MEIENIDVVKFLFKIGVKPEKVFNDVALYRIPDSLSKPNIEINRITQQYKDLNKRSSGDLLKLTKKIFNVSKELAIRIINETNNLYSPNFPDPILKPYYLSTLTHGHVLFDNVKEYNIPIKLDLFSPILDVNLTRYLYQLRLDPMIYRKYCQQVNCISIRTYSRFTDLAFQNDSSTHFLFNQHFSGNILPSDIRYFHNAISKDKLLIFLNIIDFLSFLTISKTTNSEYDVIVLNSRDNVYKSLIHQLNYLETELYFPNNTQGKDLTHIFRAYAPNSQNMAQTLYADYQNINELLRRRH